MFLVWTIISIRKLQWSLVLWNKNESFKALKISLECLKNFHGFLLLNMRSHMISIAISSRSTRLNLWNTNTSAKSFWEHNKNANREEQISLTMYSSYEFLNPTWCRQCSICFARRRTFLLKLSFRKLLENQIVINIESWRNGRSSEGQHFDWLGRCVCFFVPPFSAVAQERTSADSILLSKQNFLRCFGRDQCQRHQPQVEPQHQVQSHKRNEMWPWISRANNIFH